MLSCNEKSNQIYEFTVNLSSFCIDDWQIWDGGTVGDPNIKLRIHFDSTKRNFPQNDFSTFQVKYSGGKKLVFSVVIHKTEKITCRPPLSHFIHFSSVILHHITLYELRPH